ncbi:MAG: efflux RND transporter periplasmic adaptor subunit [Aquabacterium sp.]|nr:efflux RND transporter periplasmic adaptor subunit [Aquabacterium sp.]
MASRKVKNDVLHWTANAVGLMALCALLASLLTGCGPSSGPSGAVAAHPAMPPAQVGVVTVRLQTVPVITELPGRLEAVRTAQVRARVAGIIEQRQFVEGADVRAGQALFQINASAYKAALDSAAATQAKAQANLAQTTSLFDRYKPLHEAKAISPQEFVNAQVAQQQAQADVAAANAALQIARINLGYASVTAPISGRIGRALTTEGALVGVGDATPLAVIQQVNTLYVNFTQSANEVVKRTANRGALIHVVLDDGSEYPLPGKLLFSDVSVDSSSGQVALRAELPNPHGVLLPGMYVRVRLEQAQLEGGVLLPQQAVTRNSQGDTVLIVDAQGKVTPRPVTLGGARGTQWVVLRGLAEGDQVMVDGFQKMMNPKAPVKAVPWVPQGAAPAASH